MFYLTGRRPVSLALLFLGVMLLTFGQPLAAANSINSLDTVSLPNEVRNGDFEGGTTAWQFYTNGKGNLTAQSGDVYSGAMAAYLKIEKEGSNVQLYQTNITLEPNQRYRLHFAAKSSGGENLDVFIHQHEAPYTNYGLAKLNVPVETTWKTFDLEFTTRGFATTVSDARLRFYFAPYDASTPTYNIDHVVLENINDGVPPPPDPEPPPPDPPVDPCVPQNALNNNWNFYSSLGYEDVGFHINDGCEVGASVRLPADWEWDYPDNNVQLYLKNITLQPKTRYRLYFKVAPASDMGSGTIQLYVHKHGPPYTNYGLNGVYVILPAPFTTEWKTVAIDFTTTNFSDPVTDARLRIWFPEPWPRSYFAFDDMILMPAAEYDALSITETLLSQPLISAESIAQKAPKNGATIEEVLTSGYFIDDDDAGRMAGARVPATTNEPPVCDAAQPSRAQLWPAQHQWLPLKIVGVQDPDRDPVRITITSIYQDEPVSGLSAQDRAPDGRGLGRGQALLRAERDDAGNGRVYHISFTAVDRRGGTCSGTVTTGVPISKGTAVIDDGPLYDATQP